MQAQSTAQDFIPIIFQIIVALGFVVVTLIATHFLGPKRKTLDKLNTFEAGIEAVGNARQPFSIKYFLVAILFVLFDIEVIFMYPWAVNFKTIGLAGLLKMGGFISLLLVGYLYIVKRKALEWEK